jgi:hypothetical protein
MNKSFSVYGTIPDIQSAITIGKDNARLRIDIPLHNQDQRQNVMLLQNLMNCVFKLTFEIESVNQKDYFYPEQKEPANNQITDYQTPDEIQQIKNLRQKIHLELMNSGMEPRKPEIIKALTGKTRERDCTKQELNTIWAFIVKDEVLPITNYVNLRSRLEGLL